MIHSFRTLTFYLLATSLIWACSPSKEKKQEPNFEKLSSLMQEMEIQGGEMAMALDTVAHYYQYIVTKKDSIRNKSVASPYKFKGAFSTNLPGQDSSLSSIIILNSTSDRKKAEEELLLTNPLDRVFSQFIKDNPKAAQIYSNSAMQLSRVYPAYDAKNIVDADLDVTAFNFYYEADLEHNPSKGLVWIPEPYVDPAGKGWILSVIHPVYDGEELFAVLGVDYTVSELIEGHLESAEGDLIVVNSKGDIVAGKTNAINALSMPPLKNHVYRETINSDYFRISDFNLFNSKSREVREMAQRFLLEKKGNFEFEDEANLSHASCVPFSSISWFLIEVFPVH